MVTLAGRRPHAELPDWYRASDLAVLPSYSEGLPNVLREAVACGRPFVATRVGGIPEIADPSYSRLVSPGSPPELADAIRAMLAAGPAAEAAAADVRQAGCAESARLLAEQLMAVARIA
jgi:teichuronic acid biosynthesis glycosyltransferase TuaC